MDKKDLERLLKEWFPKGSTAHTSIRHVNPKGTSRHIKVFAISGERIQNVSYYVSKLLNWKLTKNDGVFVSGCGMDMGFHLVYTLSSILYKDGYALTHRYI